MSRKQRNIFRWIFFCCIFVACAKTTYAQKSLKFGIHPYQPSAKLLNSFAPMTRYLSKCLKQHIEIEIAGTYGEFIIKSIKENATGFKQAEDSDYDNLRNILQKLSEHGDI